MIELKSWMQPSSNFFYSKQNIRTLIENIFQLEHVINNLSNIYIYINNTKIDSWQLLSLD